jgi:hypothetical protein
MPHVGHDLDLPASTPAFQHHLTGVERQPGIWNLCIVPLALGSVYGLLSP